MSIVTLFLCSAPVNIITDLAILVLPIPVLTGMRLPQRQKTVLVFTFALGIFVTIVDVVRIYYLQQAASDQAMTQERLGTEFDFAWNASTALMWSAVEVNIGIICACIPTLKPLVKHVLPSIIADRSKDGSDKIASSDSQAPADFNHESQCRLSDDPSPRIQPLPPAQLGGDREQEMNMMDFLTTPGIGTGTINKTRTAHTAATDNSVYFGFVNMKRPKSMLQTRGLESFKYCTIVTILFFLWGFSYGLLNTLNNEISQIAHQSTSQNLGLTSAYFGAYFFGALTVGQWTLRHGGFKATFISGLCIYGTGTLMFWPSAVLTSFPGFIISNFVVGFGLSVLETAANPFLALCGPSQYAECRLLLAQGVQAVGTILSQLLAQKVLFSNVVTLIDVQWTYLAVTLFTVILALFFYYMPLPEATDADLKSQSETLGIYPTQRIFASKLPLIYTTLALAAFAQFTYVAAQEGMSIWFGALLSILSTGSPKGTYPPLTVTIDDYTLVGQTTFAAGRFLFAPLCLIIHPRVLLFITMLGGLIFSILTMSLKLDANGVSGPALMFFFFEGPVWPMVYAIGLRGLGSKTKIGAALITAAASGGAIFPFVMWAVHQLDGKTVQYSFCVIVAMFAFGLLFPIYLNLVPAARHQVDPRKPVELGRDSEMEEEGPETPIRRLSRRFSVIFAKISPGGSAKGANGNVKASQDLAFVEHRESQRQGSQGTQGS